jgi:hypothetical protein
MTTTYQIYNLNTGKVHKETQSRELLVRWLEMNTIYFLAADYGYFPRAGECFIVIDKENDFDVTQEIIRFHFQ